MSPGGARHNRVTGNAHAILDAHVRPREFGRVLTGEAGFVVRRQPDTVRSGDIAQISDERLPQGKLDDAFLSIPPELVIEMLSTDVSWAEMENKVAEYHALRRVGRRSADQDAARLSARRDAGSVPRFRRGERRSPGARLLRPRQPILRGLSSLRDTHRHVTGTGLIDPAARALDPTHHGTDTVAARGLIGRSLFWPRAAGDRSAACSAYSAPHASATESRARSMISCSPER